MNNTSKTNWEKVDSLTEEEIDTSDIPQLDIVRIQDVGLIHADDPTILEWAANEQRILLTHDVATITVYAYERIKIGLPIPGVVEVIATAPIGQVIDDLYLPSPSGRE